MAFILQKGFLANGFGCTVNSDNIYKIVVELFCNFKYDKCLMVLFS